MSSEVISLSHGSGGKATNKLINNLLEDDWNGKVIEYINCNI